MMSREVSLVVLFADVSRSTQLYETLGDHTAQGLVATCLTALSTVTNHHGGTVVKTIGDEIMCTFPDATLALEAAQAMQRAIEHLPEVSKLGLAPLSIRIGFHLGTIVHRQSDVFGDAVNVAARIVALAKPRQILTTEPTVNTLLEDVRAMVRCIDRTTVKGKSGEFDIYEAIWDTMEMTFMATRPVASHLRQARLRLWSAGTLIEIDHRRPFASLGRHSDNEIVVPEAFASRLHCRVEYRRGKFVLVDQSTNGTYVAVHGSGSVFLHREEMVLEGSGVIGLGREVEPDGEGAIHFIREP
jgi:class 3 adenylate cyclase